MLEINPNWQQIILDLRRHYKNMARLSCALDYRISRAWLGHISRNGSDDMLYSTGIRLLALHEKHCKNNAGANK